MAQPKRVINGNRTMDQLCSKGFELKVIEVLEGSCEELSEQKHLEIGQRVTEMGIASLDQSALEVPEKDFSC